MKKALIVALAVALFIASAALSAESVPWTPGIKPGAYYEYQTFGKLEGNALEEVGGNQTYEGTIKITIKGVTAEDSDTYVITYEVYEKSTITFSNGTKKTDESTETYNETYFRSEAAFPYLYPLIAPCFVNLQNVTSQANRTITYWYKATPRKALVFEWIHNETFMDAQIQAKLTEIYDAELGFLYEFEMEMTSSVEEAGSKIWSRLYMHVKLDDTNQVFGYLVPAAVGGVAAVAVITYIIVKRH